MPVGPTVGKTNSDVTIAGMATLDDVATALAVIREQGLRALRAEVSGSPDLKPGLVAWIEAAVDWELHRRRGFVYHLFGPHAAIDDTEAEASLVALAALAGRYRQDGHQGAERVADFLDLAAAMLSDVVMRAEPRGWQDQSCRFALRSVGDPAGAPWTDRVASQLALTGLC